MPKTLAPAVGSRQRSDLGVYLVVALLWTAAAVPLLAHLEDGPRAEVTFVNDTAWDIDIDLILSNGSRVPLATIEAGRMRTVKEIFEPGAVWRFRWLFAGRVLERTQHSDEQLRAGNRRVRVPDSAAAALRAANVPPSP